MAVLSDTAIFFGSIALNFKTSIAHIKSVFSNDSICKLLEDFPRCRQQYALHTFMWTFWEKWDLETEMQKLESLPSKSPATDMHKFAVMKFLAIQLSFKRLFLLFFSKDVCETTKKFWLTAASKTFGSLKLKNNLSNYFANLCTLIDMAMEFPEDPLCIFLDIVIPYLLNYLINFYNLDSHEKFLEFMSFLKNKKIVNLLCPHLKLIACCFVKTK